LTDSTYEHYPIGTPGQPWTDDDKKSWLAQQSVQRSYGEMVLDAIEQLASRFTVDAYGHLPHSPDRYPLLALRSRNWQQGLPAILVTGGVHGYEISGVLGALRFLESSAQQYEGTLNLVVAPCISPWGFETINRWNVDAIDPNRSFYSNSPAQECASLMQYVAALDTSFVLHIDLHETTDTDGSEFRPALAARDGKPPPHWEEIPDGFYLVGDSENPQPALQAAIIDAVSRVTHIAEPDNSGNIIGEPLQQHGVINYPVNSLHLCAGITSAPMATTTEVYPDSPLVDGENCIQAQVIAVEAAISFLLSS
jgi:hypothetical protein